MVFWHASGSSRRNSQVDSRRWSPENCVWARFRAFKRLSPNQAVPSVEIEGAWREGLFQHR
eukprot:6174997-Pyramimonas_sp.AAC.1